MRYSVVFHADAFRSWQKLDKGVRDRLKAVLDRRLDMPFVPADALTGALRGCYKIKIHKTGHRLVYQVIESEQLVFVRAVGQRADKKVYSDALKTFNREAE